MPSSSLIARPFAWERAADGLANDPDELSFYLATDDLTAAPQAALYTADWTATGAAWETAANWTVTDPGEPAQSVPGADDVVSFGDKGSHGYTVTYNSTSTIAAIKAGTVVDGVTAANAASAGYSFITLASFDGANGAMPLDTVYLNANGDVFGTTSGGGASNAGTVFEIAKTASGYASAPQTLVNFNGVNGFIPWSGLIADANGDLFGTTDGGGPAGRQYGDGIVFEIVKTASGYASAPTTLIAFTGANGAAPASGLTTNSAGDLLGTTLGGGPDSDGTVFEIVKTANGYASALTTLATFDGDNGLYPSTPLIADSEGDLFGVTAHGGATFTGAAGSGDGVVYEIPKTASGFGSLLVLASFEGGDGANPVGSLIFDASGDLFGATQSGGLYGDGTVFEIVNTANGYVNAPATLINFDRNSGDGPTGLVADAAGNLFGTTYTNGQSTLFEIVKTGSGYSSVPAVLAYFQGSNGAYPNALSVDAAGDLFGTTEGGGPGGDGTVFEMSHAEITTDTWAVNASGDWGLPSNWAVERAPQAGDIVDIYPEAGIRLQVTFNSSTPLTLGGFTLFGAELDINNSKGYLETAGAVTLQNATIGGSYGAFLISKAANTVINVMNIGSTTIFGSNGKVTQSAGDIEIGYSGAAINNGSWMITDASGVTGTGIFANNGVLIKTGAGLGVSTISAHFTNNGKIFAASGSLIFTTAIQGSGGEGILRNAYLELDAQSSASQKLAFGGFNAELGLGDAGEFQSSIYSFGAAANEAIDLIGFNSNATKSFASASDGVIVNISDGANSASLHFVGSYNQAGFQLNTGSNGELLTYSS